MAKWLLVDGFNLVYRCFFAIPELKRSDGFPTNALHGWIKSLWMLGDQERPAGTMVFFDLGGPQERLALHPEYKAHRPDMPDPLRQQIPYTKTLTRAMGLVVIEQDGVECDDLMASEACALAKEGHEVLIVSSDKDFAQIVGDNISIMLPPPSSDPKVGWRRMDAAGVRTKFGVEPKQIADYLALVGDTVDNIPGIAGVGPKTASKWIGEYGSLEGVIAHAAELKPERFREAVAKDVERLRMNLKLTTLNCNLPTVPLRTATPQVEELLRLLGELEMKTNVEVARKRYSGQAELLF